MKTSKRTLYILLSVVFCVVLLLFLGRSSHRLKPVRETAADSSVSEEVSLIPSTEPETTEESTVKKAPRKVRTTKKAANRIASFEAEALRYTNEERRKLGLEPLNPSASLLRSARVRAVEITVSFSHTRPDGRDCFSLDPGFIVGENIAWGQVSPKEVVNDWMNSPSHRENIVYEGFKLCAIACYYEESSGIYYWAQLFA